MTNYNIKREEMWDQMLPGWEQPPPPPMYRVYAASDTTWRGLVVMANKPFPCHLCGEVDKWTVENEHVFVCEHEPVALARGGVRQISSVAARLVGRVEEVET